MSGLVFDINRKIRVCYVDLDILRSLSFSKIAKSQEARDLESSSAYQISTPAVPMP